MDFLITLRPRVVYFKPIMKILSSTVELTLGRVIEDFPEHSKRTPPNSFNRKLIKTLRNQEIISTKRVLYST